VPNRSKINIYYLKFALESIKIYRNGNSIPQLTVPMIRSEKIPLPPLSIQQQIVNEIEGYQKVIDGARQVIENYKSSIRINPDWEEVELGDVCENLDAQRRPVTKSERSIGQYPYYGASGIVDYVDSYIFDGEYLLISEDGANLLSRTTPIAFSVSGKIWVNNHVHILKFQNRFTQKFIEIYINSIDISSYVTGSAQPKLNQKALNEISVPMPSLEEQEEIVRQLEMERLLVDGNKQLIARMEQKIKDTIAQVWGEEKETKAYEENEELTMAAEV